jgi:hypothetical protein
MSSPESAAKDDDASVQCNWNTHPWHGIDFGDDLMAEF